MFTQFWLANIRKIFQTNEWYFIHMVDVLHVFFFIYICHHQRNTFTTLELSAERAFLKSNLKNSTPSPNKKKISHKIRKKLKIYKYIFIKKEQWGRFSPAPVAMKKHIWVLWDRQRFSRSFYSSPRINVFVKHKYY